MRTVPEWRAKHDDQAIPLLVRLRVFEAHGGICQGPCHRQLTPRDKHIHFDHKISLADGGEHREGNLWPMCIGCHQMKTGQEATARARTRSIKAKAFGIKKPSKFPNARNGKWKTKIGGRTEPRHPHKLRRSEKLSEAGWPRPIVNGWPIPWVSPSDNLSEMDPEREAICASGKICAVCGEPNGAKSFILIRADAVPENLSDVHAHAMDNGVMHRKCLLLALARCPELQRLKSNGLLQIIKCETSKIRASTTFECGASRIRQRATVDGAECEIVSRRSLGEEP